MPEIPSPPLLGQKALVLGIANEHSIAYGCARAFRKVGAELAITYLNDKARPYVEPLARELEAALFLPLDVYQPGQLEAVFDAVRQKWGRLDIALHSIAFAPKADLQGGLLNCSAAGFGMAMDVSCHSFVRMARLAAPLMTEGGTLFAMTYYGAGKVVPSYSVMGPVKAALEAAVRYLAHELGPQGIRVHAISPGPIKTRVGRPEGLRPAPQRGRGACPGRRVGGHRRRRHGDCLPGHALRPAADGKHALRRCGAEHHGVAPGERPVSAPG
jgi:enoyl-[acyl-carrier protein] reductase I